jgi:hypothetical protein
MLPALAGEGLADAVDAFCERIGFSPRPDRRVFEAARELGLPVKLHAEQLSDQGGAALVARSAALSADHLEHLSAGHRRDGRRRHDGRAAARRLLLPARDAHAAAGRPARRRRAAGRRHRLQPRHLAHDLLLLAMNMACTLWRLTPLEALRGCTVNAARALGRADIGSLEVGKRADFALWDIARPADLAYAIGANPCREAFNAGVPRPRQVPTPSFLRRQEPKLRSTIGARSHPDNFIDGPMPGSPCSCSPSAASCSRPLASADDTLHVGSKRFTESYILGEILTQAAARTGPAEHRQGLGNTAIVLSALRSGAIDVYPEYLGTIDLEILKNPQPTTLEQMRAALRPLGLGVACRWAFPTATRWPRAAMPASRRLSALAASRRSRSACRTNSSAAPTAGPAWRGATACRSGRAASTTASPTRR